MQKGIHLFRYLSQLLFHYFRGSQPGVLVPLGGMRLNIKGYEDPWVTEQLIYLL